MGGKTEWQMTDHDLVLPAVNPILIQQDQPASDGAWTNNPLITVLYLYDSAITATVDRKHSHTLITGAKNSQTASITKGYQSPSPKNSGAWTMIWQTFSFVNYPYSFITQAGRQLVQTAIFPQCYFISGEFKKKWTLKSSSIPPNLINPNDNPGEYYIFI